MTTTVTNSRNDQAINGEVLGTLTAPCPGGHNDFLVVRAADGRLVFASPSAHIDEFYADYNCWDEPATRHRGHQYQQFCEWVNRAMASPKTKIKVERELGGNWLYIHWTPAGEQVPALPAAL